MLGSLLGLFLLILHIGQTGEFPPPLSEKEEHELLKKMAENDESARAELIEHNLRLVAHIVKKYYANADDQDDLISIGTIGLIKGVDSYKPEKKVRLATYAAKCVENEILMYFRKKKRTANEVSLSEHIDTDKDGNELSLIDVISEEDRILDTVCQKMRVERLLEGIRTQLDGRERTIIELRYGLTEPPMTQKQTAQRLGVSRSYISRLEKKALLTLRKYLQTTQL
ncbi:MAG: RNA polymerase sporulation sigma factor SigK [Eubacteriales bacterium]|nr:RNA polymerase sporulation sigma factor SigK [Eubacteriales bacterium]